MTSATGLGTVDPIAHALENQFGLTDRVVRRYSRRREMTRTP